MCLSEESQKEVRRFFANFVRPVCTYAAAARCCSIDSGQQIMHAVTSSGLLLSWDLEQSRLKSSVTLLSGAPPTKSTAVAGVQYLQLDDAVVVAFTSGDLMLCLLEDHEVCSQQKHSCSR